MRTDYQAALEEITDLENRENEFKTLIGELETQKKTLSDQVGVLFIHFVFNLLIVLFEANSKGLHCISTRTGG